MNFTQPGRISCTGTPPGYEGFWLAHQLGEGHLSKLLHIAADDRAMERFRQTIRLMMPQARILTFPAWDCLPYDRVGPNPAIAARRIDTLWQLAHQASSAAESPISLLVVITTVNAWIQRLPPPDRFAGTGMHLAPGSTLDRDNFVMKIGALGYQRVETVMEPGEFALRGGLVDLFPAGEDNPIRIDLFGDEIERLRGFDALSQRSLGPVDRIMLKPISEVPLTPDSIDRFRSGYRTLFGMPGHGDTLYAGISEGRHVPGQEHWLPLFLPAMAPLVAYLPDAVLSLDSGFAQTLEMRLEQIHDFHEARIQAAPRDEDSSFHPLPPDRLYLNAAENDAILALHPVIAFDSFAAPSGETGSWALGGRQMINFAAEGKGRQDNPIDLAVRHIRDEHARGRRVLIAGASTGSIARLKRLFADHGLGPLPDFDPAEGQPAGSAPAAFLELPLDQGFSTPALVVISESDILGHRLSRPERPRRNAEAFLSSLATLEAGDLVVHSEHGIGRYDGLETLDIRSGEGSRSFRHDCLRLLYAGNDKLYVPVENIDLLTRYGEDQGRVSLDRLGGVAWQSRKARMKSRLKDMAEALLNVAAARALSEAPPCPEIPPGFEAFCARFPYAETEDQQGAIDETLADLAATRPMDRLICGDVGFGKTEIALRAAFVAAMSGHQVAVVVPTTLLARQHHETFRARFEGLPVSIGTLSRLVTPREAAGIKEQMKQGRLDIVIGTHALLAKDVSLPRLGLLIIDEEQHFGVAHKERLKAMRSNVHVLTLTATPIPRTLQLALTGVKEMSLITTPPVDRLAVRTFVSPYDSLVVGEAIRRELHRGGQCFYVCPRISDIAWIESELAAILPEVRAVSVHGQMSPTAIEGIMASFLDGAHDVLIATNIIESGLDMPNVNTIIIHRADMFGLGQLYQLRGRVGRSRQRAYAYLTLPPRRSITAGAVKRLHVMQSLDTLGAGFSLASHDLDLRGAGNLLGEEQSGHIREVGIELYQQMLEETVASLKGVSVVEDSFSPQITLDLPVLIPESYVADLGLRLSLYRRIATLSTEDDIEAFAAELIDRFGALPQEVDNLLAVVGLKLLCRRAGVERVDTGNKGCVLAFHKAHFANPAGLIERIAREAGSMKLRPDHSLVIRRNWPASEDRLLGLRQELTGLVALVKQADQAPPAGPVSLQKH